MPTVFRLAEILAKLHVSQAELVRRSGIAPRTIARLCHNETGQVSLATLDSIATTLKVEPGELIARAKSKRK